MVWQRFLQTLKSLLKVAVILGLAGFLFYRQKLSPVPVQAVKPERGTIVSQVMGTGTLDAHTQATISPKIQGRLVKLTVDQNDRVTTGQLLAILDDKDLKEQVAMAQATMEANRASLSRIKVDEKRAQAVVEQARLDFSRFSTLKASGAIAVAELDKSRESMQVAEADVTRSVAAIIEAQRQIDTAEKSLRYQEARLADGKIFSPFAGLITRRDRQEGDIVVPGACIFQLVSTDDLWVSAWVDEAAMADLRMGLPVQVIFRSEPKKSYPGSVIRVGREVDRETREFLVDIRVDELPQTWAIGQRAEVYIERARKDKALRLPARMISWKEQKPGVFVIHEGKAAWRELTLGLQGEKDVEIVQGLTDEDLVLTAAAANAKKLVPGRRVRVEP